MCSSYSDQETRDLVVGFEKYVASAEGQQVSADAAGSAPLTAEPADADRLDPRQHRSGFLIQYRA
ncbi:hypothetical protein [Demequina litorisediminis]|uniref:hypothetical protein n=1 Tax=Demequina litorisediminis TaxID=1849022 RepID=UPI0032AFCEBA